MSSLNDDAGQVSAWIVVILFALILLWFVQ